ncbi:MAG: homocysteine S-methyltransferase family protein [Deltaproteobacteria bacterium]|jgi:5-methyltetrahydrofolate--homocysteine methyltransferase|nr:homocysteine S-methyltransferase family protein [Deltaproteobacteria bacterium]
MMATLSEFILNKDVILLDGAMGTRLDDFGLEMGGHNNITHPQIVQDIHREYAGCGCDILITNTLSMNRIYIETHQLDISVRQVNQAGVKLAKSAAGSHQYLLGDIGSTGKLLEPYGDLSMQDALNAFKEQAVLLAEGGVDGFIIETMIDLREALCALQACKAVSSLPIIASMSFANSQNGGHTVMGNSTRECARALSEAGVIAIGANCGDLGPSQMASIIEILGKETSLPTLCMPNAGIPKLVNDQTVFDLSPQSFAAGISECIEAGVRLVGGCCGTSPEHIRALKGLV